MIDSPEFEQFNWMVDMVQNIDMGLIVVDRDFTIQMWNGFMVHHTGKHPNKVQGKSLFEVFPEIPEPWFRAKCRPVFELKCRALWYGSSARICSIAGMCAPLPGRSILCTKTLP